MIEVEADLLKQTIEILMPVCTRLIRVNGGIFKGAGGGRVATYRIYGEGAGERLPDLIGLLQNGRFLAVEVETDKESQRNEMRRASKKMQKAFLDTVESHKGVSAIVRSVEDATALAQRILTGSINES